MAKSIIPADLIDAYKAKKIDRETITTITGIDYYNLTKILYRKRVKVWDGIRKEMETTEEIIELYKKKKATRLELAKMFNKSFGCISAKIRHQGIKIWDEIRRKKNNKKTSGKYFSLKDYKSHYFFNYNQ
ncbi:MAG: hypothetical protein HRF52_04010 [Ignavibacterium sp.]|jgi:hypothetical protein|uniref:hypothetical protein n=1 Tax=Ignavibacterium sp. TaxID=2651167 RepID=UPI00329879AF